MVAERRFEVDPAATTTAEGMQTMLNTWAAKLNELQAENDLLRSQKGIRKVIQSGNKELVPKKFQSVGHSGSFKAWAREVKDYARMADPATLDLLKIAEDKDFAIVLADIPLGLEELDKDLHYFLTRFLDGEAKLLSLNAEIGDLGEEHKSGTALWRLLYFNYEKKSAYAVVSVVEMIKNVEKAKALAKEVVCALTRIPELEGTQGENPGGVTAPCVNAEEIADDKDEEEAKFVVNVDRRRWEIGPVAILHSRAGCWRGRYLSFNNYELIMGEVPNKSSHDLICKRCWPAGPPQFTLKEESHAVAEETSSSATSSSSSS